MHKNYVTSVSFLSSYGVTIRHVISIYYIDNSVLSNVPSVIDFDNSHWFGNVLPLKRHYFDINPPITDFWNSCSKYRNIMKEINIINRLIDWLSWITKIWSLVPKRLEDLTRARNMFRTFVKSRCSSAIVII